MNNHVTFQTSMFNMEDVKEYFINPCCFGDDCAAWLAEQLPGKGFTVLDEPGQEDWGWELEAKYKGNAYWFNIGLLEDERLWLVWVEPQTKFFRKIPENDVMEVCSALHHILQAEPQIGNIRWYDEADWKAGATDIWRQEPGASF